MLLPGTLPWLNPQVNSLYILKNLYPSTKRVMELSASALQLNAFAWGYEIKIVICIRIQL